MAHFDSHYDAIVVGGGVGGGAFATVLAREGFHILVLERDLEYRDRVRGEWFAPWGVAELQRLDLYDPLVAAGGHHLSRSVRYGDDAAPDPETTARDLTTLLPGIPGPLTLRHPVICEVFNGLAISAGATVLRGVSSIRITPGSAPRVAFTHDGVTHDVACDLIVGADGRNSTVRQQAGIELHRDAPHHLFTGLLVENAHGWDPCLQATGTEGEIYYLIFPQGNGRVRLYIGFPYSRKSMFSGPDGPQRFLEAFRLETLPGHEAFVNATPAGPCHAYPNEDTWSDEPFSEGVLLIGDAAGWNDPITGQGLSITMRDVRIVTDLLRERDQWCIACLQPYAEERAERMRRLRYAATISATISAEFGDEAQARRRRARARLDADPSLALSLGGVMVGPEAMPPQAYDPSVRQRIFAPADPGD